MLVNGESGLLRTIFLNWLCGYGWIFFDGISYPRRGWLFFNPSWYLRQFLRKSR